MENIYLKIKIKKTDQEINEIRDQGIFFDEIADALFIDRDQIIEIDRYNYRELIKEIKKKYNDKS